METKWHEFMLTHMDCQNAPCTTIKVMFNAKKEILVIAMCNQCKEIVWSENELHEICEHAAALDFSRMPFIGGMQ